MTQDHKAIKERLATVKVPVSTEARVRDNLLNWFLTENPPAHKVSIVAGTLKQSNRNSAYWEATVQTVVFFATIGPKIHNSKVYFHVDGRSNIINKKMHFKTI